ncbi:MAG TPA: glycerol-3-phosphate acyltransferase [Polyangia bacterium]|nr:glycerol-3-phosphate acyltransferase [Polyangia bacterium]
MPDPATSARCLALALAVAAAVAYLAGSINFSIILSRLLGRGDPRAAGSGNAGATNLARTLGRGPALLVLALDLGRAFAVLLGGRLLGLGELSAALALPLLLGNLFPLFHSFRGGKGVATATGAMLAIDPAAMLCGGGVFLVFAALTRRSSAGSLCMAVSFGPWLWLFDRSATEIAVGVTIGLIIPLTHRANIRRLLDGSEPRLGEIAK